MMGAQCPARPLSRNIWDCRPYPAAPLPCRSPRIRVLLADVIGAALCLVYVLEQPAVLEAARAPVHACALARCTQSKISALLLSHILQSYHLSIHIPQGTHSCSVLVILTASILQSWRSSGRLRFSSRACPVNTASVPLYNSSVRHALHNIRISVRVATCEGDHTCWLQWHPRRQHRIRKEAVVAGTHRLSSCPIRTGHGRVKNTLNQGLVICPVQCHHRTILCSTLDIVEELTSERYVRVGACFSVV